jgi:hypothetical protein
MNTRTLPLFTCLLAILSGCVFISEPDVGASAPGPELGSADNDGELDALGEPSPGDAMESGNGGEEDGGNQTDGGGVVDPTDDGAMPLEQDAQIEEIQDSAVALIDSGMVASDSGTPQQDASTMQVGDMNVAEMTDAAIDPSEDGCSDIVWDCRENGYCDPTDRLNCALTPGFPACYPFATVDNTNPEAYARCCGDAGSCNRGNFCEPEGAEFSYCWLNGRGASCYIGTNPISSLICR